MRKAVNFFNEIHMRGRALAHAESAECGMPYGGVLRMSPMRPKGEKPMQIRSSRVFAIVTVLALAAVWTGGGITARAQYIYDNYYPPTPTQGPPAPSSSAAFLTVDTFLTPEVYGRIDQAISDNNRCYLPTKMGFPSCFRVEGVDDNDRCIWGCMKNGVFIPRPTSAAMISVTKKRYAPWMAQTLYPDQPNESQAKVGFFMVYSLTQIWGCSGGVCFDFPFSRTVSQAIDVYVACKGWQNGTGDLGATTVVERAYMDPNHSLLEDTLFGLLWNNIIPSIVDSRIRSSLSSFGGGTGSFKSFAKACNRLGVSAFLDSPKFDSINYALVPVFQSFLFNSGISVRVTQIRRLPVHQNTGAIVRYPTETNQFELWVGYSRVIVTLPPMAENQTYFPTSTAAVSVSVPASQLILIATMRDLEHYTCDPSFAVFTKANNWGGGTQRIYTPKIWSEWSLLYRKPILMRANGYEVTLQITPPNTGFIAF